MGPATAPPRQAEPAVYVTTCRSAVAPWMPARQRRYAPSSLDKRHLQALRSHVLVIVRQNDLDLGGSTESSAPRADRMRSAAPASEVMWPASAPEMCKPTTRLRPHRNRDEVDQKRHSGRCDLTRPRQHLVEPLTAEQRQIVEGRAGGGVGTPMLEDECGGMFGA